jgi:hypothetical protein
MQRLNVQSSDIIIMSRETRKWCLNTQHRANDDTISSMQRSLRSRDHIIAANDKRRMNVDQIERRVVILHPRLGIVQCLHLPKTLLSIGEAMWMAQSTLLIASL